MEPKSTEATMLEVFILAKEFWFGLLGSCVEDVVLGKLYGMCVNRLAVQKW